MISRRRFIQLSALAGFGVATASGYALGATTTAALELRHITVPLRNLPPAFDGYTIGFVSDMHLGYYVPTELIASSADLLRAERCDLIALGGDYIWHPDEGKVWPRSNHDLRGVAHGDLPDHAFTRLADIYSALRPPDGVIGVLGNHDMWIAPRRCREIFAAHAITIVENRAVTIVRGKSEVRVGGVADLWTGYPRFPFTDIDSSKGPSVLLAHNPDYVAESLGRADRPFDLALCGHTHGGQIRLPFGGVIFDNVADKRFVSGLVKVGHQSVFTTNGIGVVEIPLRINCPPEAVVITLRSAESTA